MPGEPLKVSALVIAIATAMTAMANAESQSPTFASKNFTMIIGSGTGGGLDLWGRAVARHISGHLPGSPVIVPKNLPGGGGIVAANHIYNIGSKDGAMLGIIPSAVFLGPLTGAIGARFDARKFAWVGTPAMSPNVCFAMAGARVKTFKDLLANELIVGTTGAASGGNIYPKAINGLLGTKFKLVSGFAHASNVLLALERREVDGTCQPFETIATLRADWIKGKRINFLFQGGARPSSQLEGVPYISDLARSDEQRQAIEFLYAGNSLGRPVIAPPGVPPEQVRLLREAFNATIKDPKFLADAKRQKLDVQPENGENLEALVQKIYATPRPIVDKVTSLIK